MPQLDLAGTHLWATSAFSGRTLAMQWLRGFDTNDIPHVHQLLLTVLPLHERSFRNLCVATGAVAPARPSNRQSIPARTNLRLSKQSPKSTWDWLRTLGANLELQTYRLVQV